MTTTNETSVAAADGWKQITTGSSSVTIQLSSPGPIRLKVQNLAPDAEDESGFLLESKNDSVFSANGLAADDAVFVKAISGREETMQVMAT